MWCYPLFDCALWYYPWFSIHLWLIRSWKRVTMIKLYVWQVQIACTYRFVFLNTLSFSCRVVVLMMEMSINLMMPKSICFLMFQVCFDEWASKLSRHHSYQAASSSFLRISIIYNHDEILILFYFRCFHELKVKYWFIHLQLKSFHSHFVLEIPKTYQRFILYKKKFRI